MLILEVMQNDFENYYVDVHKKLQTKPILASIVPKSTFVKDVLKIVLKADLWPAMLLLFKIYYIVFFDLQILNLHNAVIMSNY